MVRTRRRIYPALPRYSDPFEDALDTGSNKSALLSCNKLLKKYPKSDLLKVRLVRVCSGRMPSNTGRLPLGLESTRPHATTKN